MWSAEEGCASSERYIGIAGIHVEEEYAVVIPANSYTGGVLEDWSG